MSSHGGILSVRSKHFVKLCVVLSNTCIWAGLYISSGNLQRWSSYVCFVALMGVFIKENPPKKWSNCCLLRVRKDWKFLENAQKWLAMWSIGKLRISSLPTFFGAWQCDIFWLTSFKSSIRAWLIKQSRVARNFLIACSSYHVTSTFWNECTLSSCLNVKELLNRNRCDIWSLSNCNRSQFHNHFFQKWKLNHLVPLETLN